MVLSNIYLPRDVGLQAEFSDVHTSFAYMETKHGVGEFLEGKWAKLVSEWSVPGNFLHSGFQHSKQEFELILFFAQ